MRIEVGHGASFALFRRGTGGGGVSFSAGWRLALRLYPAGGGR